MVNFEFFSFKFCNGDVQKLFEYKLIILSFQVKFFFYFQVGLFKTVGLNEKGEQNQYHIIPKSKKKLLFLLIVRNYPQYYISCIAKN